MKTPLLGGQSIALSSAASDNRLVNMYMEVLPDGGTEPAFLTRCPGLLEMVEVAEGPIRGLLRVDQTAYVVSGQTLYRMSRDYEYHEIGTIAGTAAVSMSHNGLQIMIVANPKGYIYTLEDETLVEITDEDFPGAVTVDYLDGYFTFNEPVTQKFWVTSLYDGTEVDALEFTSAEGNPDKVVAVKVSHRELWVFGVDSVEVYYNSGAVDFPFSRISGAFIEVGCAAPLSIAKLDNSLFWLGSDERGSGIVYRADGYSGVRVSDHSVEFIIQNMTTIEDAVAYSYQQGGHSFYVLTFPTEQKTLVYDVATGLWHERAGFSAGNFTQHRGACQMVFNNQTHVGDFENGKIYTYDHTLYDDSGYQQKWLRSWRALPVGQHTGRMMIHHQLTLDCKVGVGTVDGAGRDAWIMLRWSDDDGKTWSNTYRKSLGRLGEYKHRVVWYNLGRTRDRIYELSGTDPVRVILFGAELRATVMAS